MKMTSFIHDANDLLAKMRLQTDEIMSVKEFHEKQLQMYSDKIDMQMKLYEARIADSESRWSVLRKTVWALSATILCIVLAGSVGISTKPSMSDVKRMDYATISGVVRSNNELIDNTYDVYEREGIMSREESYSEREKMKKESYEAITNYTPRGIKNGN